MNDIVSASNALRTLWILDAAARNDVDRLQQALSENPCVVNESDLSGRTALHAAAATGASNCLSLLLARHASVTAHLHKTGSTPMHLAATADCVNLLLNRAAPLEAVDTAGKTPLHEAAWAGRAECVRALLCARASPNRGDNWGRTPLHWAACPPEWVSKGQCAATVSELLSGGALVDAATRGHCTPLHWASQRRCSTDSILGVVLQAIQLLLRANANVNARDEHGETPLHKAAAANSKEVARALLDNGADAGALDRQGRVANWQSHS